MAFDWKTMLKNIAPTLAFAAGGPLAGTATKFLAEKFMGNPDATEDQIAEALRSASPDDLAKLREIDNEFASEMKKLDVDIFKLEIDDRKSAREVFKITIWPQIALSTFFVVGYFLVLWAVLTSQMEMNEGLKAIAFTLIGVMSAEVTRIMAFWFGSSMGSKEKTNKLK